MLFSDFYCRKLKALQVFTSELDRFVGRLLLVDAQRQANKTGQNNAQRAERAFGFSLIFSGIRCILQYVVLPFILPVVGIAADAAIPILLVVNLLAMVSIFYSLRRFWQINYEYKWPYLLVAIAALLILAAFTVLDLQSFRSLSGVS